VNPSYAIGDQVGQVEVIGPGVSTVTNLADGMVSLWVFRSEPDTRGDNHAFDTADGVRVVGTVDIDPGRAWWLVTRAETVIPNYWRAVTSVCAVTSVRLNEWQSS
jgi:hypothetical protein